MTFKSTVGIVDIEAMLSGRLRRHLSAFAAGGGNAESAPVRVVEILLILAGGTALVYATGGTKFVWPHVMYFAVVLAGVTFGVRVGVLAGVVAGLLMGPVMPLDVAAAVEQPVQGWLIRMGFYVAIGALAGYTRYRFSRLLDRRSSFLSSVSHEIRTPLSAVVGFAQILDKEWDGLSECEKREMAAHIVHESVEVAHVVDDLLVAARLDGGRLQINPEFVDVRDIADSILASLPHDLAADRVRIHGSGHLWADPVRVRHMLRNLITNALIHGGGSAFVDVSSDAESVRIIVTEDGGGISELMLPRLFEPFVDTEASTMPQSVGLGLAVARELARRMGGRLTYRRENGHGVFTLELPAGLALGSRQAEQALN